MVNMKNVIRKTNHTQFVPQPNSFVTAMTNAANIAYTEKGALTNKSTLSSVLDWFGAGGAFRQRQPQDIQNLFSRAFSEDRLLATRISILFPGHSSGARRTQHFSYSVQLAWPALHGRCPQEP